MDSEMGFPGSVVGLLFAAASVISIVGAGLNVYAHVHPRPTWKPFLNRVWWFTVTLAGCALAYLLFRHLVIDATDADARMTTYMATLAMGPCIVAGLVSLLVKP